MKTLIYQVYTGRRSRLYDACTYSVAEYAERIGAEYIQQRQPILMIKPDVFQTNRGKDSYEKHGGFLPIFEKENAFAYLSSYDKVAIIDADVYVRPQCSDSIFDEMDPQSSFAGVLERDMPLTKQYQAKIANYSQMQYGSKNLAGLFNWESATANFYNMGIMVLDKSIGNYLNGDTPQQFLRRPRFKAFVDGIGPWKWSTDQTLLNVWIKEERMPVTNLSYKWNALYTAVHSEMIKDAHFIHFFLKDKLPHRGENIQELLATI